MKQGEEAAKSDLREHKLTLEECWKLINQQVNCFVTHATAVAACTVVSVGVSVSCVCGSGKNHLCTP